MEHYTMNLTLKVWKQKNQDDKGGFETYKVNDISSEMSFLEMFDVLNEKLITEGKEPITFDHDCREGICGACSMYINGRPHGPWLANTTCQLHMRAYKDGDTITAESIIRPGPSVATSTYKNSFRRHQEMQMQQ